MKTKTEGRMEAKTRKLVPIDVKEPIWTRFFMVAPLVIVGTREGDHFNLAPKHMATPVGWDNYFAFVCTPRHSTYRNMRESGYFTVSFPKPSQVVLASITAEPRCGEEREKPDLEHLSTFPATNIDGVFLEDSYLFFECKMEKIIDGFGKFSIIVGFVEAVLVDEDYVRRTELDDSRMINEAPLLAYLSPGRYAAIKNTNTFPFPSGFEP